MSTFPNGGRDGAIFSATLDAIATAKKGMTDAGHPIYNKDNTPPLARVYLDGALVGFVIAACPAEGWIITSEKDTRGVLRPVRRTGAVEVRDGG